MTGPRPSHGAPDPLLRQLSIVALLVGALVLLHHFAVPSPGFDPRGLLAFGFVVLASYTIGALVDIIKLPHITGYLLAGMVFGPSFATLLPDIPPFDQGVLNREVIEQLSLLDALAVALIALNAGGELKLEALRSGLRAILGILFGQFIVILLLVSAFLVLVSGMLPAIALPGMGQIDLPTAIALGAVVSCVSFATSPAATLAVINESGAVGPMARTVMSTVVLKDVVVVLGFTIAAVIAAQYLGIAENDGHLLADLLWHIGGSLLFGAGVGGLLALYLRFVNKEVLLVLVGVVYTASFVASELHLDTVLLFLAAGFAVANFSRHGHALIESVERLSMPVFVVFFTLAGAKLHLDEVVHLFFFAAALVLVRGVSIFLGARFGARLAGADEGTRRYGWLGFLSQAGVAITLSTQISEKLGEPGKAIGTLLIAGVAINEMIGPVLLKVGLSLAGEVRGDPEEAELEHDAIEPEPEPEPRTAEIEPWPEAELGRDPWGSPPESGSTEIDGRLVDLQIDLQRLVRDLQRGPIERFRGQAEAYVRELRREFLRHHRRLTVQARIEGQGESLASMLRSEQAELADRWRGAVLGRSARLASRAWSPEEIVEALDYLVDTLPQRVEAAHTETSFVDKPKQSTWMALSRSALRWNRTLRRRFGKELRPRAFDLRAVARYHLGGQIPARLEGLAAILVQADRHLAARTRSLLDGIVMGYDSLAIDVCGEGCDAHARLVRQREQIEEELGLALEEIERMARDATRRTARILGRGFQALKEDVRIAGTIDLPERARRTTKVFKARSRALELFGASLRKHQEISAAGYSLLAMELELVGLEARVKDSLEEHVSRIESAVRGRTFVHAERVHAALEAALEEVERELSTGQQGDALAAALRRATELPERAAAEGARAAIELRDTLYDESRLRPLIQALSQAAVALTSSYEVVVGRVERGEWTLPSFPARVEVPFRETVITYVDTEVAPELLVRTRALAERLEPYVQALQELGRTIAFNVELATAELEVVHDEEVPRETLKLLSEMIAGQLERSETLAASFVEQSARWPDDCGEALRDSVLGALDELRGALVDGDVSRARLAAMRRADARRRLLREAWQLPRVLRELREQMAHAITVTIGEQRLETWRKVLGLPASRGQHLIDASLFAAPESRAELPPVYRRLFAAETLEAGDVLLGRDDEIACAEAALGSREVGRLRAVALVGLDGVGKAAVSNAIVRSRGWRNVARISFDAPVSLEEIDALFAERSEGRLVVIDGLHWMIAMRPGGFAPLRRFVDGIVADGGRNAWLVHADLLFWRYASSVAALSDAFPEQVHLHPLTVDELEAAVMARHRLSGYGHLFERAERSSQIEGFVERSASRIRRPYERYFAELHEATGGLVRDALRMWVASIREVQRDELVHVGRVPPSPFGAVNRLPEELLLNLYQIARQGWIDASVQAHLYRTDPSTAKAQLARLTHLGLLSREGETYRIALHLRGVVVRVLQERGWVQ